MGKSTQPCSAEGCDRVGNSKRGLCGSHYWRLMQYGDMYRPLQRLRNIAPDEPRPCTRCRVVKEPEKFNRLNAKPSGRGSWCKECVAQYRLETRDSRLAKQRAAYDKDAQWRQRLSKYGLTPESYHLMLEEQGGRCAICGRGDSGRPGHPRLYVDHCHASGRTRGLLCSNCNAGLGSFSDDPERMRAAMAYLYAQREQES